MKPLTGLFLGAGASYEAGMPLVWELTAELKKWLTPDKLRELNSHWRELGSGHPDLVINDLADIVSRPEMHYEAVLGYLEAQRRRVREYQQQYHHLYSWLVEIIYCLLYYRQVNNKSFLEHQLGRYDGLKALVPGDAPLWIFSLNHDVMIETIAARLSIPLHSGFSKKILSFPRRGPTGENIGEIQAEILTQDDLETGAMDFPCHFDGGICLMKIHGALDIFTFNDGTLLLKLLPISDAWHGLIDALRATNEDLFYLAPNMPSGKVKTTNEITLADDSGEMQFLRRSLLAGAYKFHPQADQVLPKSMLRHFRSRLNHVTHLIVIGYSFGDNHINEIMREWLSFSPERRIEIVSPHMQSVPGMFLHLSPQIIVTQSDACDFLDAKASITRSRREELLRHAARIWRGVEGERFVEKMNSFFERLGERMTQLIFDKLRQLPTKDGKPDFGAIKDPASLKESLSSGIKMSEEELLKEMIDHFEKNR